MPSSCSGPKLAIESGGLKQSRLSLHVCPSPDYTPLCGLPQFSSGIQAAPSFAWVKLGPAYEDVMMRVSMPRLGKPGPRQTPEVLVLHHPFHLPFSRTRPYTHTSARMT